MNPHNSYKITSSYRSLRFMPRMTDELYLTDCGIEQCSKGKKQDRLHVPIIMYI